MRVGIVRTDMGRGIYVADIESQQVDFSSRVPGQARKIRFPSDDKLLALVAATPLPLAEIGSNTATTVATTSPANVLKVRTNPQAAFTTITVTSGSAEPKATVVADLNTGFATAGLALHASIVGTNQIQILSTASGPYAYFELDIDANSTLNPIVGFTHGKFQAPTQAVILAAIKAAVYPSAGIFNVAPATIEAVHVTVNTTGKASYSLLTDGGAAFAASVANLVAPQLYETGDVLLSFAKGVLSKFRASSFSFKGVTGQAIYVTLDDGSTAYTYP